MEEEMKQIVESLHCTDEAFLNSMLERAPTEIRVDFDEEDETDTEETFAEHDVARKLRKSLGPDDVLLQPLKERTELKSPVIELARAAQGVVSPSISLFQCDAAALQDLDISFDPQSYLTATEPLPLPKEEKEKKKRKKPEYSSVFVDGELEDHCAAQTTVRRRANVIRRVQRCTKQTMEAVDTEFMKKAPLLTCPTTIRLRPLNKDALWTKALLWLTKKNRTEFLDQLKSIDPAAQPDQLFALFRLVLDDTVAFDHMTSMVINNRLSRTLPDFRGALCELFLKLVLLFKQPSPNSCV